MQGIRGLVDCILLPFHFPCVQIDRLLSIWQTFLAFQPPRWKLLWNLQWNSLQNSHQLTLPYGMVYLICLLYYAVTEIELRFSKSIKKFWHFDALNWTLTFSQQFSLDLLQWSNVVGSLNKLYIWINIQYTHIGFQVFPHIALFLHVSVRFLPSFWKQINSFVLNFELVIGYERNISICNKMKQWMRTRLISSSHWIIIEKLSAKRKKNQNL